ncbi:hypothetical protein KJ742_01795 [Patescibacteria group bacterium]|nr:hypothetical protein [Patescibacteria group bacterium]MBU1682657.1 hypothetical protein [Patescibacteria group bacterium]MBU1934417.1 hypothetical protein [Patescibacteria group bacterium]
MKKLQLFIVILIAIVAFTAADYYINTSGIDLPDSDDQIDIVINAEDTENNLTQDFLNSNPAFDYVIIERNRTQQIFEKFDLSALSDVRIYQNTLSKSRLTTGPEEEKIIIYEIQGESNQGRLTYLNLKMRLTDQMEHTASINETAKYGYNSFFYNDLNQENTGFLLTQIRDNLFGFQYNKANEDNFGIVKSMVDALMDLK